MKSEKNTSWNDLLFKNRNKAYGAYDLRKNEAFNLLKSLFTGLFFIGTLVFILSFTVKKTEITEEPLKKPTIVNIIPIHEKTKPEKPDVVAPPRVVIKKEKVISKDIIPNPTEQPKTEHLVKDNHDLETMVLPEGNASGISDGAVSSDAGNPNGNGDGIKEPKEPKADGTFKARDVKFMAVYPGCEKLRNDKTALQDCMSKNLNKELSNQLNDFSEFAVTNNISEANAKLLFVVDKNGRIVQVEAIKGGNQNLSAESKKALERISEKLIRKGKYIEPAKLNDGTEVNIQLSIPIKFKLNSY